MLSSWLISATLGNFQNRTVYSQWGEINVLRRYAVEYQKTSHHLANVLQSTQGTVTNILRSRPVADDQTVLMAINITPIRFIPGILLFIAGILLFTTQGACCQKSIKPRPHFKLYDMTFGMVFRANTLCIGTIYGGEQD